MASTALMEFGHIRRMQDTRFPYEVAVILPGEYFVSQEPMVVYTVLGSVRVSPGSSGKYRRNESFHVRSARL